VLELVQECVDLVRLERIGDHVARVRQGHLQIRDLDTEQTLEDLEAPAARRWLIGCHEPMLRI
jgi:hypothetical protein